MKLLKFFKFFLTIFKKKNIYRISIWVIFFLLFIIKNINAEVPIIVISPSKSHQSLSSVGSDIELVNSETIFESNENFLGDIFDTEISGSNFSRQGGVGTNSLIQLRGLPKRYTNIYLDGVKLSDPSSPDNAFYLNNLTAGSIRSIEVLKGNQSSVYGSSAIGGVVSLFSRDGTEKNNKLLQINVGSNKTKNAVLTFGNKKNKFNYSFTLEKYLTDGISAMSDNTEKDSYENINLHTALGIDLSKNLRIESNFKFHDTFLNYDEVSNNRADNNSTKDKNFISNIKIINNSNNLKNSFLINHYYTKRKVTNYNQSDKDYYYGERKNINYLGEYQVNLDKKITFGLDNEFNRANYKTWAVSQNKISDDAIISQFFDFQQRHSQKIFTTLGIRNDIHSEAGTFQTGRITSSYNYDPLTKYKASIGTGIRFGSLNDYYYDINLQNKEKLKPEKSYGVDIGLDKEIEKLNTKINLTFFYTEYKNNISNWASNTDNGLNSYVIDNSGGKISSKGFNLKVKKQINKKINSTLNYTFTNAYDGEDCDDPDKSSNTCQKSTYPVRVPKHHFSALFKTKINDRLNSSIILKHISSRRDYGNTNNNFVDVLLDDYTKIDLKNDIKLFGKNFYININNLLNKKYEDAFQYNSGGRSFNLGFKELF